MDIQKNLQEIFDAGKTDKEIGDFIGTSQPTATRLRTGVHKKTDFDTGMKILELHKATFPDRYKPAGKIERRTAQA